MRRYTSVWAHSEKTISQKQEINRDFVVEITKNKSIEAREAARRTALDILSPLCTAKVLVLGVVIKFGLLFK